MTYLAEGLPSRSEEEGWPLYRIGMVCWPAEIDDPAAAECGTSNVARNGLHNCFPSRSTGSSSEPTGENL